MAKCRIGTAKFFTLLLLLYRTSAKFDEMSHFFSVYKALEGKETVAGEVNDRAAAVKIIAEAISNYRDTFC